MSAGDVIRVGTRGSRLARIQTEWVLGQLAARVPGIRFEVLVIRTAGDETAGARPARPAAPGLFTREIESALLAGRIDLAVHSLKDLPAGDATPGLLVAAVPARESPWDALVGVPLARLAAEGGAGLRIGTGSLRRRAQLRRAFPACDVQDLRGNVDTRLRKVDAGELDGAVLAAAGLRRLGCADRISALFGADTLLPAPGQGALALQTRADPITLRERLLAVHCPDTAACVAAERAFLHALGGGCRAPVGALGQIAAGTLTLRGRLLSPDGRRCLEDQCCGAPADAAALGRRLAEALLAAGGADLLRLAERETPHA
jgi:hydroxymethylbilane synthase